MLSAFNNQPTFQDFLINQDIRDFIDNINNNGLSKKCTKKINLDKALTPILVLPKATTSCFKRQIKPAAKACKAKVKKSAIATLITQLLALLNKDQESPNNKFYIL